MEDEASCSDEINETTTELLRNAVVEGNTSRILELLQDGDIDLTCSKRNQDTVLHYLLKHNSISSQKQKIEIISIFISRGVNPHLKNGAQETALHIATAKHLEDIVDFLLKHNDVDINVTDYNNNSIAHYFVRSLMKELKKFSTVDGKISPSNYTKCIEMMNSQDFVKYLLSKGFDFDAKNRDGRSALHLALGYNLQHILVPLLNNTRDIDFVNEPDERTLLHLFLDANIDNRDTQKKPTPEFINLHGRIQSESYPMSFAIEIVKILLERGVTVDRVDKHGLTALDMAIDAKEHIEVVKMLLSRSTRVNDQFGMKLLYDVIKRQMRDESYTECYLEILGILITRGADLNYKDERGMTPVYHAVRYKNLRTVELMRKSGTVDFSVIAKNGDNFLHALAVKDLSDEKNLQDQGGAIFDLVVVEVTDVNAKNNEGQTPLHVATKNENVIVMRKLIEHRVDIDCRDDKNEYSPLHLAVTRGLVQAMEVLLDNGANVNIKSPNGRPLHLASTRASSTQVLTLLLKYKAEVNARDGKGMTPLVKALRGNYSEVVEKLLAYGADIGDIGAVRAIPWVWQNTAEEVVLRHWIKLNAAKLPCPNVYRNCVGNKREYKLLRVSCLREIEIMKRTFIDTSTSLYSWLYTDPNRRYIHNNNEKLRKIIDSPTIDEQFPQYSTVILGNYCKTLARKSYLLPAKEAWLKLTEIRLPEICLDLIFGYLNTGDLFEIAEIIIERSCFTE